VAVVPSAASGSASFFWRAVLLQTRRKSEGPLKKEINVGLKKTYFAVVLL
jgi:hypothetical protein